MSFKIRKEFCISGASEAVWDASHILACEVHSTGNGGWYEFEVLEEPTGEEQGFGLLSDEQVKKLTQWLLRQGARIGEEILIHHWW